MAKRCQLDPHVTGMSVASFVGCSCWQPRRQPGQQARQEGRTLAQPKTRPVALARHLRLRFSDCLTLMLRIPSWTNAPLSIRHRARCVRSRVRRICSRPENCSRHDMI
eukprot:2888490-Pleurochrysis_carterae.AAC.2